MLSCTLRASTGGNPWPCCRLATMRRLVASYRFVQSRGLIAAEEFIVVFFFYANDQVTTTGRWNIAGKVSKNNCTAQYH